MGRSVYLCKTEACLKGAEKKDRLSRALRSPVPAELYAELHQSLVTSNIANQKAPSVQSGDNQNNSE
jgi:predicted RNA-binding protein YlxR (DUF448 family)